MNTGVSISPCGVIKRPVRAAPERASTWNSIDIKSLPCDCSNDEDQLSGLDERQMQEFASRAAIFQD